MKRVTVRCDVSPDFRPSRYGLYGAQAAADAVSGLRHYVQISDFVTKVLIYKRFRRSTRKRELTNLET
jgi:hypothetical protein